jgi:hypothetical protein
LRGSRSLILTQIYFYGTFPGISPYQGELPFGLFLSDNRSQVRQKLRKFDATRRSYIRDVWDPPNYRIIVAYSSNGEELSSILCWLPPRSWPKADDETVILPAFDRLVNSLGRPWNSAECRQAFSSLMLEELNVDAASEVADLRFSYGLELYFRRSTHGYEMANAGGSEPILAGIKFYRDRFLDAYGWKGDLPFGIRFNDSQKILFRKVAKPQDQLNDGDLEGFALWHFRDFTLHVLYSNVENYVLQVMVMQPGFWQATHVESEPR